MKLDGVWIGDLDRLITIESYTVTNNAITGEEVRTWSQFARAWASREQKSKEGFEVAQQVSNDSGTWVMRWVDGVTDKMRLNDDGDYHYIKGSEPSDRRKFLRLLTERRDG